MVTVLFIDIRGFTNFADKSTAREAVAYLNELFGWSCRSSLGTAATRTSFWATGSWASSARRSPVPTTPTVPWLGQDMLASVDRHLGGRCRIGIGINSGLVLVGTIGGGDLTELGVIGDPVNVAARVQKATRDLGEPLLLTEATRLLLERTAAELQPRGTISLKGKSKPVAIHGLGSRNDSRTPSVERRRDGRIDRIFPAQIAEAARSSRTEPAVPESPGGGTRRADAGRDRAERSAARLLPERHRGGGHRALELDSPALRELRAAGVKLAVPLVSQGELIGVLNLGPRLSEQDYSSDDRRLLDNLAAQAAPALRVAPARAPAGGGGRHAAALRAGARGGAADPAELPAQGAPRAARVAGRRATTGPRARSAATSTTSSLCPTAGSASSSVT